MKHSSGGSASISSLYLKGTCDQDAAFWWITMTKKPLAVESTRLANTKNMWCSQITCKEGKCDCDGVGSATETASSNNAALWF